MSRRIEKPEPELNVDPNMGRDADDPNYQEPKEQLFTEVPPDDDGIDFGEPEVEDDGSGDVAPQPPQRQQQQGAPPAERQFRVKTRTGQVFTGTKDQIIQKLTQSVEHGSMAIEDRESQLREIRGQVRQQQERQPGTQGAWDPQKYLDLLGTDPMEARRYQDRFYYGVGEGEDPAEIVRFSYQVADQINDTMAVSQFLQRNEDFPATEQNATMLLQFIDKENLPVTTRNLEYAYGELRRSGKISAEEQPVQQDAEYEDLNFETRTPTKIGAKSQRGRGAPPAPAGGGGGRTALDAADFDNMSDEELEKEVNRRGMKKF